jgi:hypothetical protein
VGAYKAYIPVFDETTEQLKILKNTNPQFVKYLRVFYQSTLVLWGGGRRKEERTVTGVVVDVMDDEMTTR